jgi:hypothetical protein
MPEMAKITGIMNKPEADGSYIAELSMPDGSVTTASIPLGVAQALVSVLQPAILEDMKARAQTMKLPSVQVKGASIVRGKTTNELVVATDQTGNLVLQMSDEWLREVRRVIDLVLASRQISMH